MEQVFIPLRTLSSLPSVTNTTEIYLIVSYTKNMWRDKAPFIRILVHFVEKEHKSKSFYNLNRAGHRQKKFLFSTLSSPARL
jgi:hypothetical protein